MSILADHLRHHVVRPCLRALDLWNLAAENLLLGTAAQESHMGTYLRQKDGGPALGIYQCEPATHEDVWANFLKYKPELQQRIVSMLILGQNRLEQLPWNLWYATAISRCHYLRVKEPLPDADDIRGMAEYWKEHYNTHLGKGTVEEFMKNYLHFVQRTA